MSRPADDGRKSWAGLSRIHRGVAIVLFNTLVLLVVLEVLMTAAVATARTAPARRFIATLTGRPNDLVAHYLELPYYAGEDWSEDYWSEHRAALGQVYRPYTVWRSPPFSGRWLTVDDLGRRHTPGAACRPEALEVLVLGGSAMWGWGAPDRGTIPAQLQQRLAEVSERPVCVVNLAENAYVSTQGLIQLVLELHAGRRPDVVLFYDGVNDVLAADQSGIPVAHQNLAEIVARFEAPSVSLGAWLRETNTALAIRWIVRRFGSGGQGASAGEIDPAALGAAVAAVYLDNLRVARALAAEYGFALHFFWQPHLLAGDKPLTTEERAMIDDLDWVLDLHPELIELFAETYRVVGEEAAGRVDLHDLTGVFDVTVDQVWIDTWGHTTPEGNRRVAAAIAAAIGE